MDLNANSEVRFSCFSGAIYDKHGVAVNWCRGQTPALLIGWEQSGEEPFCVSCDEVINEGDVNTRWSHIFSNNRNTETTSVWEIQEQRKQKNRLDLSYEPWHVHTFATRPKFQTQCNYKLMYRLSEEGFPSLSLSGYVSNWTRTDLQGARLANLGSWDQWPFSMCVMVSPVQRSIQAVAVEIMWVFRCQLLPMLWSICIFAQKRGGSETLCVIRLDETRLTVYMTVCYS